MTPPLLTIIIPVFNEEATVAQVLKAVAALPRGAAVEIECLAIVNE